MTTGTRFPATVAAWIGVRPHIAAAIYLLSMLLLCTGAWLTADEYPLNTDLFSLLDLDYDGSVRQKAIERVRSVTEQRQTWIIRHESRDEARQAALRLKKELAATGLVSTDSQNPSPAQIVGYYRQYPFRLADDESVALAGEEQDLVDRVVRQLYRNTGGAQVTDLADDPFLLEASFLTALGRTPEPFSLDSGLLHMRLGEDWIYLLPVRLTASAFDFDYQNELFQQADYLRRQIEEDTAALVGSLGTIDFAHANRQLATSELTLIGGLSLGTIVVLLFGSFRAGRPAFALLITLAGAVCGGTLISLLSFGSIHLLTLIAGTSLLGISADYAFHLLADAYGEHPEQWSTSLALPRIAGPLTLGLATSLLSMAGLYASGFSGLQQIAVFSGAGLVSAYLSVWLCFPALLGGWQPSNGDPILLRAARSWTRSYQPPGWVLLVIVGLTIPGALFFLPAAPSSDIRLLSASAPEIDALLDRSELLSKFLVDTRFLIVSADGPEALLNEEESFRPALEELIENDYLSYYQQLSRFAPSVSRQETVLAANRRLLVEPGEAIQSLHSALGLKQEVINALQQAISAEDAGGHLQLAEWLQSPLAPLARDLYLGEQAGQYASITTLAGLKDLERLQIKLSGNEKVHLIDNVADISDLFDRFGNQALAGLCIAFTLVTAMMFFRFGLVEGGRIMLVPLAVCGATVSVLLISGASLNLFHIVGLTLVLGTGMDYVLFLKAGRFAPHTMLAVLLAAFTTQCAFGLLGLSKVGAIESFGITVAFGTALNLLLAPMVRGSFRDSQK